uniref:DUF2182 domain-containing protein n=1 Tax=Edaphosphingomonas laterariae TaxID=861865 RepID=UPI001FECB597|nr:DUF2182 domain-containing protein [Sphingomonas laterariae]
MGVGILLLCLLAWAYLLSGAGFGMSLADMTTLTFHPTAHHAAAMPEDCDMPGMGAPGAWSAAQWLLVIAMWWVMMVAMMLPAATPTILLYARVHHHAAARATADAPTAAIAPAWAFVAGYLLVWLGFAIGATALQWLLERQQFFDGAAMALHDHQLAGAILIAAGFYQLSPLKHACLAHCRSPAAFLARHWRPGIGGALRLGIAHGAYCVGCCWILMALLFVGGVMNLIWIAAIALLVLVEKLAGPGKGIGRLMGGLLILWGVLLLITA